MKNKKLTFIDILIIVVAVAALVFATQFFTPEKPQENSSVEFVVMVNSHKKGLLDNASAGDIVVIDYTDKYKAEITDIKTQNSKVTVLDNISNKYILKTSPLTEDTYITLKADAQMGENVIKIGNSCVRVGQHFPVRGKGYTTGGYIVDIINEQEG